MYNYNKRIFRCFFADKYEKQKLFETEVKNV